MDIPRKKSTAKKNFKRVTLAILIIGLVAGVSVGVSRLKPAAPSVERATVWIDTVKQGSMLRQVRGIGTLVPEETRWIAAATSGRVERILVKPGAVVSPGTVLVELSNPELAREVLDAEWEVKAAQADYTKLRVEIETQDLSQQAAAASVQADYSQAKLQAETNEELAKQGLISDLTLKLSKVKANELNLRHEIEQKRLGIKDEAANAQLAARKAQLEQKIALYEFKRTQMESLKVRAGVEGVVQQVPIEVGQQVTPGLNLARIANPTRLKAELKIAETQAKDIQIGQKTSVDTRNGIISANVIRIDPAVKNGTVTVDVALEGELPKGARPDLSVDGTIEIERLENIFYVGRPTFGQEQNLVGLFKLEPDGTHAVRVQVKLGRSSVNTIEIKEGLKPGDQVILSDMSAWDSFDRVKLN
ncbi:MAG: HlyD family efflux transporter periplasmic adaptor subunit [Blastocatellia bacterium]|nr:HlyD family efflux transporter periplasmic adaptor subunit [Blastocatellia bacterium]